MLSKDGAGTVRSVERALAIVELLGEHDDLGLEELHYLTGLPKATVSRLLHTLQEQGWLYRSPTDRRYQLCARRLFGDAGKRLRRGLVEHSAPFLCDLSERTGLVADLSYFDGNDLFVVESCIPQVLRKRYPLNRMIVGQSASLFHSAMGKACLGELGEDDMERLAQRHKVAVDALQQAHRQTHSQGFGERTEGVWEYPVKLPFLIRAVALPVYAGERLVGSIALHWPSDQGCVEQVQRQHMGALAATVSQVGATLSAVV
ncbi:IclR family transcriptional regulator [Pseudomonas sp. R5(2019)]|uniref:IclR family transcriptional regulator n=1 Tax=Pseudomonas sp. R5(2019) TaxID=2697566 RepID=UPI0014130FC0|nr:IclR family transcriptional regulator [Pseudomonas sp. R5(2019)]NBA96409.1 helix-turn-helix domain-containing protein [Pseudomonas sp. R5(2019)]